MKLNFLAAAFLFGVATYAQEHQTIKGYVYDSANNNEPLPYATVMLQNTDLGAEADENGYFEIECNQGSYLIEASYTGYQTFVMPYNTTNPQDISINLVSENANLDELIITVNNKKSTETALLNEQRKSLEIKQQIGAQELSRKGVSDVAAAVTKTTGVNKQESTGGIFVRGLGDRYNSTTMNGLPLVSNNPDKKNIDLDLFSTNIVEYISIDKTYLARNSGDFGGATVDIVSKKNTETVFFSVNLGANANTNALGQKDFYLQEGRNSLGFSKNNQPNTLNNHTSFTPFDTGKRNVPFGSSIGFNGGKSFFIGSEGKLDIFATANFGNEFKYKEGLNKTINAQGFASKNLTQKTYSYNTNTTGMLNANYEINANNTLAYNFLFVNGSSLNNDIYSGYMVDKAESAVGGIIQRNTYTQDQLMVHQLLGKHVLNDQTIFNWGASLNNIDSNMPDRTQNTMRWDSDANDYMIVRQARSDNHRYFHSLNEKEIAVNASVDHKFAKTEDGSYKGNLTIGYNGRFKKRDFNAVQFNYEISSSDLIAQPNQVDQIFNQENMDTGLFKLVTFRGDGANALDPQYYNGDAKTHAGFATAAYQLSPKLSAVIGIRYEKISQNVDWKTQLDNTENSNLFEKNAFLPNLNLKYEVNGVQNLRLAASKTYTLPQFKERARFLYENVDETIFGNQYLYASDNYNVDLKWEYFPQNDEVISATVFGKYIQNPINTTNIASSSNDITYLNTGDWGHVTGIEVELRKNLVYFNNDNDNKLSFGINAAYMKTNQELDAEKVARENPGLNVNFTHTEAKFTGASEFLGNADVTYFKAWNDKNIMATLAYNYNSDRIYALGNEQKGNLVDKGFGMLDFIFKTTFNENFGMGLSAKNLLNPSIDRVQQNLDQDHLVRSYKLGSVFSISLNYNF